MAYVRRCGLQTFILVVSRWRGDLIAGGLVMFLSTCLSFAYWPYRSEMLLARNGGVSGLNREEARIIAIS